MDKLDELKLLYFKVDEIIEEINEAAEDLPEGVSRAAFQNAVANLEKAKKDLLPAIGLESVVL